jgi:hypothetical protein
MRSPNYLASTQRVSSRLAAILLAAMLFSLACAAQTHAQSASSFRWLSPILDAPTWTKIQSAFQNELQPDSPKTTGGGTLFAYRFLERVGVVEQSALVIVGHKTAKVPQKEDEGERFSSAFSFDLETGIITKIDRADQMWQWKFKQLAQFDPNGAPDVTFIYLSCWECEPSEVFSTIHYDASNKKWTLREWESDKMIWWTGQDGLVVDADILEGADDTVSFTCLYGILDLHGARRENIASRCRELTETSNSKTIATDVTALYSLDAGQLKIKPVTNLKEVAEITAKLCGPKRANPLCKLPADATYNSPQLTMLGMFPTARNTRRDAQCFGAFHGDFSVYTVVDRCGRPDGGGGTAVGFLEYHLEDGSKVTIHWTNMQHVLDVVQSDKSGKTKTLLASK